MFLPLLLSCIIIINVTSATDNCLSDYCVRNARCHKIGEIYENNIDDSVDPCTDFYEYGCGSWTTNNSIPFYLQATALDRLMTKTLHLIRDVLEEETKYDEIPPIKMIKQYYHSCMDENAIENLGIYPILYLLDIFGGWPILMTRDECARSNCNWQQMNDVYNQAFNFNAFFDIVIKPNQQNVTRNILVISMKFKISYMTSYKVSQILIPFVKAQNNFLSDIEFKKYIKELIDFGKQLDEIYELLILQAYDEKGTRMTIKELQEYYDLVKTEQSTAKINWLETIRSMFETVNISVEDSEPVIIFNKNILHKLAHLLDITPSHVIVNFIQWNIINNFIPYINKEIRNIQFQNLHYGETDQTPRWITCINDIPMQDAVSYLFVKKYLSTDTLKAVMEMIEELKEEIKERILRSTWANKKTQNFMINKLYNVFVQIGYPVMYNNRTAFIEHYKELKIGNHYFINKLSSLIGGNKLKLMKFREPRDRQSWLEYPITQNGYYAIVENRLILPVFLLHEFIFDIPLAIRYGTLGTAIAHGLIHSIDTSGVLFDEFGNEMSWSHPENTMKAYENKARCFVNQYKDYILATKNNNEYIIDIHYINLAKYTKLENIAECTGIQIAFAAFQKRILVSDPQPRLYQLNKFNDEQLFFLSFVNNHCRSDSRNERFFAIIFGPAKFRANIPLINMKSFSKAFNCPVDSSMNPKSKCNLI